MTNTLASNGYFKNISSTQRLIESQCIKVGRSYSLKDKNLMLQWLNDNATRVDYIPSPFQLDSYCESVTAPNRWASRGDNARDITIWIENDEIRMQFRLTWM